MIVIFRHYVAINLLATLIASRPDDRLGSAVKPFSVWTPMFINVTDYVCALEGFLKSCCRDWRHCRCVVRISEQYADGAKFGGFRNVVQVIYVVGFMVAPVSRTTMLPGSLLMHTNPK